MEEAKNSLPTDRHVIKTDALSIMTERNQPLAATVYRPQHTTKAAVMIAPATGIKVSFITTLPLIWPRAVLVY